jgi:hypothetical protein
VLHASNQQELSIKTNEVLFSDFKKEENKEPSKIKEPYSSTITVTTYPEMIENPFEKTDCATPDQIRYFTETVPYIQNKKFRAERIFKATEDGENVKDFYSRAEGKSPTATFIKLKNKVTVAAFANEEW